MQYDPKLKKAAEEIKKILKDYDIAGFAVLHTPGFGEYILKVDPTYSCASIDNSKGRISFKLASTHYGGDKEEMNKTATATCNMMRIMSDLSAPIVLSLMNAADMLDAHLNAEHPKGDHSSHNEQNN